jgi:hypothetical protein
MKMKDNGQAPFLKNLISFDKVNEELRSQAKKHGLGLYHI